MKTLDNLTREELWAEEVRIEQAIADSKVFEGHDLNGRLYEVRYLQKTCCANCGRSGADEHYDTHGIYAGRWHDRCATAADKHRENYRWSPGDEPLDED